MAARRGSRLLRVRTGHTATLGVAQKGTLGVVQNGATGAVLAAIVRAATVRVPAGRGVQRRLLLPHSLRLRWASVGLLLPATCSDLALHRSLLPQMFEVT